MSETIVTEANELAFECDRLIHHVRQAHAEYQIASAALSAHRQKLRIAMLRLSESLRFDAMECAIRTVAAVQRGDSDEAYELARAAARTQRSIEEGYAALSSVYTSERDQALEQTFRARVSAVLSSENGVAQPVARGETNDTTKDQGAGLRVPD